jgi:alkyl sulfatase BDS1-like metallo-beta-lactamase superfamily hydrolase
VTDVAATLMESDEYARLVGTLSDDELLAGLAENGEMIVAQIFQTMPMTLNPAKAGRARVVAEWRIRGLAGTSAPLRWQVAIEDSACVVEREGNRRPDISFAVDALDFLKLVTGNARGPTLFLAGRLRISGDLLHAARYQGYFRTPGAGH